MHILWISLVPNSELQNQIPELESHSKPQIGYEKMINAVDGVMRCGTGYQDTSDHCLRAMKRQLKTAIHSEP
ncbi:hypothetical protein H4Q26_012792 [Puccinia striiformis f. sp. tritici PST-130]|uniref:Uncharacterized protein n=1 Tax=Puccinia striiformis f. sp. tritici PST-78 TaxID=1165861 RepID=A0A0L0VTU1_9BASI|nr:hypothetical protein H4Q26_012792 [Puccinia striiformis f. sp. tritici PST-130]KNF02691.1 hypothetical protein PSTG_03978 [Puccinia striiformis f. sp. tritici PST-78]